MESNNKDKMDTNSQIKIMILGNQAVGKSSIMLRYTDDVFHYNMMGTAGVDIKKKMIKIQDEPIKVMIYDTAGHDRFRQITKNCYKGSKGIMLVYDVSDKKTYESVSDWMDHIKNNADSGAEIILVGNKSDITNREVTTEDGIALASKFKVPLFETSALTGYNVEAAFLKLVQNISNKEFKKIILTTEEKKPKPKSRCVCY
jgi:small GTP-binding protein